MSLKQTLLDKISAVEIEQEKIQKELQQLEVDFANVKFKIEPAVTYVEIDLKTLLSNT